jgi:hypothetical protein
LRHAGAGCGVANACGVVPQCEPFTQPLESVVRGAADEAEVLVFAALEA